MIDRDLDGVNLTGGLDGWPPAPREWFAPLTS